VKPGLTGIGSIVFRDEEQLLTDTKKRFTGKAGRVKDLKMR